MRPGRLSPHFAAFSADRYAATLAAMPHQFCQYIFDDVRAITGFDFPSYF